MAQETPDPRSVLEKMAEFGRLGPRGGVNVYNLRGPIDVPTVFDFFAGLFPQGGTPYGYAIVPAKPGPLEPQSSYYRKILELELPERIKNLPIKDDYETRRRLERVLVLNGMPSIMVGFGKARDTGDEVVVLFAAFGIAPHTALREIQNRTHSRAVRLN